MCGVSAVPCESCASIKQKRASILRMAFYRSQWILPYFTNLPTDVVVNQMHWYSNDTLDDEAVGAVIAARLLAFYGTVYGAAAARVSYADWTKVTLKVFNLGDPIPRIPTVWNPAYSAGTAAATLPTEVAAVLSFHAAPVSGVRFQRLYNRIFLGCLGNGVMSAGAADEFPRFAPAFITLVTGAATTLLGANDGIVDWRQHSVASGTPTFRTITGGWVDNGPDTQRRRSVLSTSRNTW